MTLSFTETTVVPPIAAESRPCEMRYVPPERLETQYPGLVLHGVVFSRPSEAARQIGRLAALATNWDGRGSPAPNAVARAQASTIAALLCQHGLEAQRISATPEGGIGLYSFEPLRGEPKRGSKYIRIAAYNTGEVIVTGGVLGSSKVDVDTVGGGEIGSLKDSIRNAARRLIS